MITAQQEHKSRWRGRYWRRVELELVDGGAVILDGGSPKALVRINDEGSDVVRIETADVAAYEAARRACVLPKTEKLRLRGAGFRSARRAPAAPIDCGAAARAPLRDCRKSPDRRCRRRPGRATDARRPSAPWRGSQSSKVGPRAPRSAESPARARRRRSMPSVLGSQLSATATRRGPRSSTGHRAFWTPHLTTTRTQ